MTKGCILPMGANIGVRFDMLIVESEYSKNQIRYAILKCDCGKVITRRFAGVKNNIKRTGRASCGCATTELRKTSGIKQFDESKYMHKQYGRLLVTGTTTDIWRKQDPVRLVCRCDCGAQTVVAARYLSNGKVRSCGCLAHESRVKSGHSTIDHGHATHGCINGLTPIYTCWLGIKALCATGIARGAHRACHEYDKRWGDFSEFYTDFGDISAQQTIKRIDRKMPWSKENCYIAPGRRVLNRETTLES